MKASIVKNKMKMKTKSLILPSNKCFDFKMHNN